jgi:phosphoglycerate dehydrogenase-like enzyme
VLPVAVLPAESQDEISDAIVAGGGLLVPPNQASALIWLGTDPTALGSILLAIPSVEWVQLPSAGIESYLPHMTDGRIWTCARGIFAEPVAEHALMLALICLRQADRSVRAGRWIPGPPNALRGANITVVGAGAIAAALVRLMRPFDTRLTVIRRRLDAFGNCRVLPPEQLDTALPDTRILVLAAALTAATRGLINSRRMELMPRNGCLVNVSRGALVDTGDLIGALTDGTIASAGLDVTDPEPLPEGHPLWQLPNCFITAHCAGELSSSMADFAALVRENVARRSSGRPLHGLIDLRLGY